MPNSFHFTKLLSIVLLLASPSLAIAQSDAESRSWNRRVKPFRLIGNIYYVGASEVTSLLIATPDGHILLDSGFEETVPLIRDNITKLGFRLEDVKILINSHAHVDHAGGLASLKELTKATLLVSEKDAVLMSNGGKGDFQWRDKLSYKPVTADRILRDKEKVQLGGVTMITHLTPGHTKGNTTWTMKVNEGGKQYAVVFAGSTSAPDYKLVNNPNYPTIVDDYTYSFRLLKALPCDVFLAPHGSFFSLSEKMKRLANKRRPNPFVDPAGYRRFIQQSERDFRKQVQEQQAKSAG